MEILNLFYRLSQLDFNTSDVLLLSFVVIFTGFAYMFNVILQAKNRELTQARKLNALLNEQVKALEVSPDTKPYITEYQDDVTEFKLEMILHEDVAHKAAQLEYLAPKVGRYMLKNKLWYRERNEDRQPYQSGPKKTLYFRVVTPKA